MRVLMARGRRVSLLLVQEISPRLPIQEGFRDRAVAIRANVRLELPVSQGR